MKRNFVVSLFGGLVGFGMMFILLSAAGIVGARGAYTLSGGSLAGYRCTVNNERSRVFTVDTAIGC